MAEKKKADDGLATAIDKQTLLCSWGANGHGQLGIGSKEDQLLPVNVKVEAGDDGDAIVDVGGGGGFSYVLLASGAVQTCGNTDKGQLGQGGQPPREDIFRPFDDVMVQLKLVQLAAGWDFVVALAGEGSVYTWGSNAFGQLARDLEQVGAKYSSTPGRVGFSPETKQIYVAAGLRHALTLAADGSVFAWGHGRRGQLGTGTADGKIIPKSHVPLLVSISSPDPVTSLFAGMYHSGALSMSGSVFLWGCNKYGQCCEKANTVSMTQTPTKASFCFHEEGERVIAVCSGWTHLVARSDKGRLYSWGRKDLGQLGRSCDQERVHTPALVVGLESVKKHVCGSEHNLAVTRDGCVYTWGWNEHGICATGDEENVPLPRKVLALNHQFVEDVGSAAGHSFCIGFQKHS